MKRYARIEDIYILEIIEPMVNEIDEEIDINDRFHPDFVATLKEIPTGEDVKVGRTFVNGAFAAPIPVTLTADEIRANYEGAAQVMLDRFANSWGYDTIARAVGYVNSKSAKYKAEGQALSDWRDDVWTASETIDEAVEAGGPPPVDVNAFLAMLPAPPARPQV